MTGDPGTVDKALGLLDLFSEHRPSIGLSDLARDAGFNKATTLRHLNALRARGFVEQDARTRAYHLGPSILRLARVREASVPLELAVEEILSDLAAETGETALASILSGDGLAVLRQIESTKSNRVIINMAAPLPLHATASGLATLAFCDDTMIGRVLAGGLRAFAGQTPTSADALESALAHVRRIGHATVVSTYEDDVVGIAAPCFGPGGAVRGAVAAALPLVRATPDAQHRIAAAVRAAAHRLTAARGGTPPPGLPA